MYKCKNCFREFETSIVQHGSFSIENGKFTFNICKGNLEYIHNEFDCEYIGGYVEKQNNDKDSICRR